MTATWNKVTEQVATSVVRTGWKGVWDVLLACITGNELRGIAGDVRVSFYVKGYEKGDVDVKINRISLVCPHE